MGSIAIIQKTYSLNEIMQSVQSVLLKNYSNRFFWVRCELSRISLHAQSGHCYLELIDKNETAIVAQQRGIIWADKYNSISEKFKAVTNTPLSGGMKVLLQCSVSFHPVHGLSLTVSDIEPSFTLGEMARMKNEAITRLKSEGLFNINRLLKLSLLPKRIAIVSVATSRGYQDFISTLANHQHRFSLDCRLFEAILQGDNAVPTLIRALNKIFLEKEKFDAIAIIRGGAGDAGLACYDDYTLSALIARSPLPVITGIGHATNETVVEMIAFKNCITPTAAATFILEKFDTQFLFLSEQSVYIKDLSKTFFNKEKQYLSTQSERFCLLVRNQINIREFQIKGLLAGLPAHVRAFFSFSSQNIRQSVHAILNVKKHSKQSELLLELNRKIIEIKQRTENLIFVNSALLKELGLKTTMISMQLRRNNEIINHLNEKIILLDPVNTLMRGYSITRLNGKALTNASVLVSGMLLETQLANGNFISTVELKNDYGKEKDL